MEGIRVFDDGLRLHPYLDAYGAEDTPAKPAKPAPKDKSMALKPERKAVKLNGDKDAR